MSLSDRETSILQAVIHHYVATARPAGSRTLARRYNLGWSPATIRNTMSDLEEAGYLTHPHTSAGRLPTDKAYRFYVDRLVRRARLSPKEQAKLAGSLARERAEDRLLSRAVQLLSALTQELGLALAPRVETGRIERLELVRVSAERLLLVVSIQSGVVRTIFLDVPTEVWPEDLSRTTEILNERLTGLTLGEVAQAIQERLRGTQPELGNLFQIFVQSADQLFDVEPDERAVVLQGASTLASQPEFSDGARLRELLWLTEERSVLAETLVERANVPGLSVTIGEEHDRPALSAFSIITSVYRIGELTGTIGVMGPTRMPYRKVIALVDYTSRVMTELLSE